MNIATRMLPKKLISLVLTLVMVTSCQESGNSSPDSSFVESRSSTREKNILSCDGNVRDVDFEYDADYIVLDSAVERKEDGSYNEHFWVNTLYFGSMHMPFSYGFVNKPAGAKFMAMYPNSLRWEDVKTSETTYPYDVKTITMADKELEYYEPAMVHYLKFIKKNGAKKGEKAVRIKAKVNVRMLLCFNKIAPSLDSGKFQFNVPIDPLTVFEVVPKSDWRPIRNPIRKDVAVTNPCMDPEGVTVSPENPIPTNDDFFYYWHPTLKSNDDEGKPFDCSKWYVEDLNYRKLKPRFFDHVNKKTHSIPYEELVALDRPWKVSIITGIQRQTYKKFDEKWLRPTIDKVLVAKTSEEHLQLLPHTLRPGEEDLSLDRMLIMLWRITRNMTVSNKKVRIEPGFLEIDIEGELRLSGKKIELALIIGNSSSKTPEYESFKKAVGEKIVTSDVFTYEGHSGFGQALEPGNIGIAEAAKEFGDQTPKNQILAFFSCQSLFYYHPGMFSSLPRIEHRAWVNTLGDYRDVNGNGSLGILASLEQYSKNRKIVPFNLWAKEFANDNFMMLSNDE